MVRSARLFVTVLGIVFLAGCGSTDRSAGLAQFAAGRFADARAFHERLLAEEPKNAALEHNEAGVSALADGDVAGAHRHLRDAFDDLDDLSATTGDTVSTFIGSSESRRWKGEPYERCMNAYYLGITYWLMSDVDNAAASFKAGLLRDADSAKGDAQSDFAILWYLLGQAQRTAAHNDRGAAALERARELRPNSAWAGAMQAEAPNVVFVIESGLGPKRVPTGAHGSDVTFRRRPGSLSGVTVELESESVGRSTPMGDIFRQATTRGEKVIDRISGGKAVFKDAAVIGGAVVLHNSGSRGSDITGAALIAAGLLASAQTDTRHWANLPDEIHVLDTRAPDGDQTFTFRGLDHGGAPNQGTWHVPVRVVANRTTFVWVRVLDGGSVTYSRSQP